MNNSPYLDRPPVPAPATNRICIAAGNRAVIAGRNDADSPWHATLYVNTRHGMHDATACITRRFQSEAGVRRWAAKQLES